MWEEVARSCEAGMLYVVRRMCAGVELPEEEETEAKEEA
jgi:hypothetical protein